ncbi:unnamed protein product, partial [Durusdinium trenchii]
MVAMAQDLGSSRRLHERLRACTKGTSAALERFSSPSATPKLLKCLASAVAWCKQGRCGPLRAVQLPWGSRHRAPSALRRSTRALLSGVRGKAHLLNALTRYRYQSVMLRGTRMRTHAHTGRIRLCQSRPVLAVLHVVSPRERGDGQVLQLACAKLLVVLGPHSAVVEVRRQVLRHVRWKELARAEGPGLRWSHATRPSGWSLLWHGTQLPVGGPDVFCVNGLTMQPVMSIQFHNHHCERCCIGPGHIARKWAGRAGEFFQLHEEEPWGCLLSKGNASCISHIRQLLSCEKVRAIDIGSVDWLTMRENMWKALVFAREGSGEGFRQGLHRQLDKIAFEAEHGDFTLDMGRADWISKFRTLFAQHLLSHEEVPGCIVGHVTLQLFMVFFVDSRGHGVFRQELESASSAVNQSLEVTPICFSHMTAPQLWNQPNVLATRLSLFKAIRWMHLLESGWPIFKIFSLVTHAACVMKNQQDCSPRCTKDRINYLMLMVENKVSEASEQYGNHMGPQQLQALALELWRLGHKQCGPLSVAIGAASCAVAMARLARWRETHLYITLAEFHLLDLSYRLACVDSMLLQMPQFWEILGYIEDEVQASLPHGVGHPCHLSFCPDGGSPDPSSCSCGHLYREPTHELSDKICIISTDPGDDRPLETNLSRLVAKEPEHLTNFWSITYHLNRLYALLHGYRFRRPQVNNWGLREMLSDGLYPPRRVQWAIVRLVQQELEDRSCEYVAWLDSDAYIASSEPLEMVLEEYGLINRTGGLSSRRLFFFASALARHPLREGDLSRRSTVNISDHFMIVRNTPVARQLMAQWFRAPLVRSQSLGRFREHLFLEQTVMNEFFPKYPILTSRQPPVHHFEGFAASFARHSGGIKDQEFEVS